MVKFIKGLAAFLAVWWVFGFVLGFVYSAIVHKSPSGAILVLLLILTLQASIFTAGWVTGYFKNNKEV